MTSRTLRRLILTALAVAAIARVEPARGGGGGGPTISAEDLLTARDHVPTRAELDATMGATPLQALVDRALTETDVRLRLRAIRALAQYPSEEAHSALLLVLDDPEIGSSIELETAQIIVLRRACLEALAELGDPDDVAVITEYLNQEDTVGQPCSQRDLRAAAAHALRVLGSTTAEDALYARQAVENCGQVEFAINEALRELLGGP
jgi:HEAT repeat protein